MASVPKGRKEKKSTAPAVIPFSVSFQKESGRHLNWATSVASGSWGPEFNNSVAELSPGGNWVRMKKVNTPWGMFLCPSHWQGTAVVVVTQVMQEYGAPS